MVVTHIAIHLCINSEERFTQKNSHRVWVYGTHKIFMVYKIPWILWYAFDPWKLLFYPHNSCKTWQLIVITCLFHDVHDNAITCRPLDDFLPSLCMVPAARFLCGEWSLQCGPWVNSPSPRCLNIPAHIYEFFTLYSILNSHHTQSQAQSNTRNASSNI